MDPEYKESLKFYWNAQEWAFEVPWDVFSTQQIDEGTRLLLDHLSDLEMPRILDIGCGYGALGIPAAQKLRAQKLLMVDRDLLAVHWAGRNARRLFEAHQGLQWDAVASLGYDRVPRDFEWDCILCNVPARIGQPFLISLFEEGFERLSQRGEIRVVVIRDLGPVLEKLSAERCWELTRVVEGPRHSVYRATRPQSKLALQRISRDELYVRDQVEFLGKTYVRPFDWGGDDPKRLKSGLSLALDLLPRNAGGFGKKMALVRGGYGILAAEIFSRSTEVHVVQIERDLMPAEFALRNVSQFGFHERLSVIESARVFDVQGKESSFDLGLTEAAPGLGRDVFLAELNWWAEALKPGGEVLWWMFDRQEREWMPNALKQAKLEKKLSSFIAFRREGYVGIRFAKARHSK